MKTITNLYVLGILAITLVPQSRAITLSDTNTTDNNIITSASTDGGLGISINMGEYPEPFDSLVTLTTADLAQSLNGIRFEVLNLTPHFWAAYQIEFFNTDFTSPISLALNSLFIGPQNPEFVFSEWSVLPSFNNAQTIELTGGKGVQTGSSVNAIITFHPPKTNEFTFGIRQRVVKIPDHSVTSSLLGLGLLVTFLTKRSRGSH